MQRIVGKQYLTLKCFAQGFLSQKFLVITPSSYISWVMRVYIVLVKNEKSHTKKATGSEFRRSLATWLKSRVNRKIQHVMDSSNSSMCFTCGLLCGSAIVSQSRASREIYFFTDSSPISHTQPLHKIPQKYKEMIEQNYNHI